LIKEGLNSAEQELINNGVVAVGDICNTNDSFELKTNNRVHYHSFMEAYGILPQKAGEVFEKAHELYLQAIELGLSVSISPHAPYTCSVELLDKINQFSGNKGKPLTIHNQESQPEDDLFRFGNGELADFYHELGIDISFFQPTGKSSLEWLLPLLPAKQKILLVHNTFTSNNDMKVALVNPVDLYWCLCPKANLYIERKTPEPTIFSKLVDKVTIGTDSFASNDTLSILEELKILQEVMPSVCLDNLLKWATHNGAKFLDLDGKIGTLEKGKKPGLNLIVGVDIEKRRIKKNALVHPLF
jgi:cytosine/adenosine deaminase-related metal-dependent hydrolase